MTPEQIVQLCTAPSCTSQKCVDIDCSAKVKKTNCSLLTESFKGSETNYTSCNTYKHK